MVYPKVLGEQTSVLNISAVQGQVLGFRVLAHSLVQWMLTLQSPPRQFQFVGLQEFAVEFDGLPAVVSLAVGVHHPLQEDAEGAGGLKCGVVAVDLQHQSSLMRSHLAALHHRGLVDNSGSSVTRLANDLAVGRQSGVCHDALVLHREHISAGPDDALFDEQPKRDACASSRLACTCAGASVVKWGATHFKRGSCE